MVDVSPSAQRIVKTPVPVALIRRMDGAVLAGKGGFQTRTELVIEAISNLLDELDYPEEDAEPPQPSLPASSPDLLEWETADLKLKDLAGTAIEVRDLRPAVGRPAASRPDGPLLGLHNRDYPSIWALARLADYTRDGPIPFGDFLERATREAWALSGQLMRLEGAGPKSTLLFPSNPSKVPSAEKGFQIFAIGSVSLDRSTGEPRTTGPLFVWGALDLKNDADMSVALSPAGFDLLRSLSGLSLDLPHSSEHARIFMEFLAENAPSDRWGFGVVVRAAASNADRTALLESLTGLRSEWSEATVSSVAQGYISRAREWGLIEEKLHNNHYVATERGRALFAANQGLD
jgi:hypothetical protein